jgi:hypothetical protein
MNNTTDYDYIGAVSIPTLTNLLDLDLGLDAMSLFVMIMILFYVFALLSRNSKWKRIALQHLNIISTPSIENDERV